MSRNIKEIGKELLGKSLNSYHRRTGLTQLEENNKMQDGILDGILSQVDDAYIKKTEQSNVIHLDGSGDGVVVLDNIEGNTMVNLVQGYGKGSTVSYTSNNKIFTSNLVIDRCHIYSNLVKPNTKYTLLTFGKLISTGNFQQGKANDGFKSVAITTIKDGIYTFVTDVDCDSVACNLKFADNSEVDHKTQKVVLLEGDFTNREVNYFEGLQSSFEEKVNDEGKYEIEILSNNKNLVFEPLVNGDIYSENGQMIIHNGSIWRTNYIKVKPNTTYIVSYDITPNWRAIFFYDKNKKFISNFDKSSTFTTPTNCYYIGFKAPFNTGNVKLQIEKGTQITSYTPHKSNKIKLLLDEPLRGVDNIKDKFVFKDGQLMIERNCGEVVLDGKETWGGSKAHGIYTEKHDMERVLNYTNNMFCDKLQVLPNHSYEQLGVTGYIKSENYLNQNWIYIINPNIETTLQMKEWLSNNPIKIVYKLAIPYYEEVLNEYGEPILLEGYENGTIYIDSTIIPTTTVRYTPKMESFNTLKEVNNNNIMLTNDVNDNIIPYMMDVDLMIMEKEMALMSQYKIRRIGAKDMTSMQKRTQDMLTRLIKGKTLTEQECKTRVVTYLNAGKITDTQAEELMLLIDEVYA